MTVYRYDAQYRVVGAPVWIHVQDIGPEPWVLTGLLYETEYEAQFRAHDPATGLTSRWSESVIETTGAPQVAELEDVAPGPQDDLDAEVAATEFALADDAPIAIDAIDAYVESLGFNLNDVAPQVGDAITAELLISAQFDDVAPLAQDALEVQAEVAVAVVDLGPSAGDVANVAVVVHAAMVDLAPVPLESVSVATNASASLADVVPLVIDAISASLDVALALTDLAPLASDSLEVSRGASEVAIVDAVPVASDDAGLTVALALAPTLLTPPDGSEVVPGTFTWEFNAGRPGATQARFAFRRGMPGAHEWWDGVGWVEVETYIDSTDESLVLPAGGWS